MSRRVVAESLAQPLADERREADLAGLSGHEEVPFDWSGGQGHQGAGGVSVGDLYTAVIGVKIQSQTVTLRGRARTVQPRSGDAENRVADARGTGRRNGLLKLDLQVRRRQPDPDSDTTAYGKAVEQLHATARAARWTSRRLDVEGTSRRAGAHRPGHMDTPHSAVHIWAAALPRAFQLGGRAASASRHRGTLRA